MKMRKRLAVILAAAMITSVIPMSAFAASTNWSTHVVTVEKGKVIPANATPLQKIKVKDAVPTNQSFHLNLEGAEWDSVAGIVAGLEKVNTTTGVRILQKDGEDTNRILFEVKGENENHLFEAHRENTKSIAVRQLGLVTQNDFNGNFTPAVGILGTPFKGEIAFPISAKVTGSEALIIVNKFDTTITSSQHVFAKSDTIKAKVIVGDTLSFYSTTAIAKITLEELYARSLMGIDENERWFTIELQDADFTFNVTPDAKLTGQNGYRNIEELLVEGTSWKLSNDRKRLGIKITDTFKKTLSERGNIVLSGIEVVAAKDAKEGKVKAVIESEALFAKETIVVALAEYKSIEQGKPVPPSAGTGSSGSSSSTPSKPTETQKSAKEIITTVTNITNGTANITVSQDEVKDSIKKAQAEAKKNGTEKDGVSMEIKADTKSSLVENVSAKLSKGSIDEIVKENVKELSVSSELGTINLDLETLKTIQSQVGGEVEISAKKVDISTLSEEVKAIIGGRPVYDFSITDASGTKVTEFGKGKVSITIPYTLDIKEKSENVVVYYIDDEGKLEEMLISAYDNKTGMLSFVTDHFSKFAVGYKEEVETEAIEADEVEADLSETSLTDIASHWAKKDIEFVIARGLFSGTAEGVFSPNMSMTRGMLVTVLGRFDEVSLTSYTNSSFNDVKSDAYYMPSIEWAREAGIVSGVSATEFSPNQAISREQLAVIITNYAKTLDFDLPDLQAENSFADNQEISDYAKVAVKQMQMAGIISGKNDNKFDPTGTATRAEVSAVMRRLVEMIETN